MVRDKRDKSRTLSSSTDENDAMGLRKLQSWCELSIYKWCSDLRALSLFPGLLRVSLWFLAMIPGTRGLECDIKSTLDIQRHRKSCFALGIVEAVFVITTNNGIRSIDSTEIVFWHRNKQELKISNQE